MIETNRIKTTLMTNTSYSMLVAFPDIKRNKISFNHRYGVNILDSNSVKRKPKFHYRRAVYIIWGGRFVGGGH